MTCTMTVRSADPLLILSISLDGTTIVGRSPRIVVVKVLLLSLLLLLLPLTAHQNTEGRIPRSDDEAHILVRSCNCHELHYQD